ncbi:NPCBM/NEW2 domain-containing protein [Deinococcus sp. S9]|uniref:NPCBM/NEW2 domain-containing protein n=1 Tax=Deinococcus sp. S9 TaxID=2545754 RepID=UPI0010554112|nr:NPCBM/NEW2 domain-containing protein [Deinococcus sp. S9]TDE86182.1 choice-of-anchor D domain-containing protein [Deinococcus sp. S9]
MKDARAFVGTWCLAGRVAAALLLVGCAQTASQRTQEDFVYDGGDYRWRSDVEPGTLSIDPGDNTLSFEPWISATSGFGPIERDRSNGEKQGGDGHPLTLGGQTFARGFGVHADSDMTFSLAGRCQAFSALVGVDDEVGERGSVVFQVFADGTKVYDSGVQRGSDGPQALNVDVTGKDELRLVVTDAGDGLFYDHADWAQPMLHSCTAASPVPGDRTLAVGPTELIYSGVVGRTSTPQTVTVRNTGGGPLRIDKLALGGEDAAAFRLVNQPAWPLTLQPGERLEVPVVFAPGRVGVQQAQVRVESGAAPREVKLYGLSARGEEGDLEPPLQQVVQTLGYTINVGGSGLILGTRPTPIGDEVLAPLFQKAGPGPVTLRPVARYSPNAAVPFGYYTPGVAGPTLHQVAVLAPGAYQTLNPPIQPGGAGSFEPGDASFGLYTGSTSYAQHNSYTQDALNAATITHAARIYPLRDRAGQPLPNSFLVAFEPALNGDYQDYVFVLGNVKPAPVPAGTTITWKTAANSPLEVYEAQGADVNGRLYVFGGFFNGLHATARAYAYDPATDRWSAVASMPEPLTHGAVAVDGQTVYVAGGFVGDHPGPQTNHVWKYDTVRNTWSPAPSLPGARGGGALVRVGRELHFFGGTEREPGNTQLYRRDSADHWVLNLDGGRSWTSAAPLPNPRNHMAGVALGGRIYAIGGQHLGDEQNGNQRSVEMYDPATDTWTPRADLPRPLGHTSASTVVWNGRIVVVGGVTQRSAEVANIVEYDPNTNAWTELTPLPAPRQSPVAGIINNRLVVTTGWQPDSARTTTWIGTR